MNTALYYPHLYPPPRVLKLAALCWDRLYVATVVSGPKTPRAITKLDRELGGVLKSVPFRRASDSEEVRSDFERWLESHPAVLAGQPLVEAVTDEARFVGLLPEKAENWAGMPGFRRLRKLGLARYEERYVRIPEWEESENHGFEMMEEAPSEMEEAPSGLAFERYEALQGKARDARDEKAREEFMREAEAFRERHMKTVETTLLFVPKDIALHYLALCAAHLAEKDKRDLLASEELYTAVVFNEARAREAQVSTAVVEALIPRDLETLEPARIAELREDLRLERGGHFQDVKQFVEELEGVSSVGDFERLERDAVEEARRAADGVKRAYRRANLEVATQVTGISLTPPALATSIASLLGIGIFAPAGVALAFSLVGAQLYLRYQERKDAKAERWSYVAEVARRLT